MKLALAFAATLAIAFCSPAVAETFSLKDLDGTDLSITSGDKLFDQFQYTATGDMPPAEGVNVSTFTDQDDNHGIRFTGAFLDHYTSTGGSDATICFRVMALDPNKLISDAHLVGNTSAIGDASIQVFETFLYIEPDKDMSIHSVSPGGINQRVDSVYFDGHYRSLLVEKDIIALVLSEGSLASISVIDQTFSQVLIPEPSTVVILITGLALLGCFVRRNRR